MPKTLHSESVKIKKVADIAGSNLTDSLKMELIKLILQTKDKQSE